MQGDLLGQINWLSVVLAVIWMFFLGFAWYSNRTPLGRLWARGVGLPADFRANPGDLLRSLLLAIFGSALTATVLAYLMLGMQLVYDSPLDWMSGVWAGLFVWVGFYLPVQLGILAWEQRSWQPTLINAGYYLLALLGSGILIGALR